MQATRALSAGSHTDQQHSHCAQVIYDWGAQLRKAPDVTCWSYHHLDTDHSITASPWLVHAQRLCDTLADFTCVWCSQSPLALD